MQSIISVSNLVKTYAGGYQALKGVNLEIRRGELFALLGPNGAGKTTLINIICRLVTPTSGKVSVDGHDILRDFRAARATRSAWYPRSCRPRHSKASGRPCASAAGCSGKRRTTPI